MADENPTAEEVKTTLRVTGEYSVYELHLNETYEFVVSDVPITFRPATAEEVSKGFKQHTVFVSGRYQRTVNERMRAALAELAERRLPAGSSAWDSPDGRFSAGSDLGKWVPPRSILPAALRQVFDESSREIGNAVTEAIHLVRWRSGTRRMHRPLGSLGGRWSLNDIVWHTLPSDLSASIEDTTPTPLRRDLHAAVQLLASSRPK